MFSKPKDYDSVGNFKVLPADGYVCRILNVEETMSSKQKPMLKVSFDICDGEYANYFMDLYKNRKANATDPKVVKWPFNGTKWIMLLDQKGKTNRDFKSFCTALIDSGVDVWTPDDALDVAAIKNADVGIIFRREEQEYEGKKSWRTVPWGFRSVEAIESGNYFVPDDKPFKAKPTTPYSTPSYNFPAMDGMPDNFSAAEDDIPF